MYALYAIGKDAAAMKAVVGEESLSPEEKVCRLFVLYSLAVTHSQTLLSTPIARPFLPWSIRE